MEKLNRAQKCSILGPQNRGSGGGPGPPGPPPGSAPESFPLNSDLCNVNRLSYYLQSWMDQIHLFLILVLTITVLHTIDTDWIVTN